MLVRASEQTVDAYQAIITGKLSLVNGGCLGLTHGGVSNIAVFPMGTVLATNGVTIPGLGEFAFGDLISSRGGYVPFGNWANFVPADCTSEEIIIFS